MVADAEESYQLDRAAAWSAELNTLAASTNNPWLLRDVAIETAEAAYSTATAPAVHALAITGETAERDFALTVNPADLALAIANATAAAAHDLALAHNHWLDEVQAARAALHEIKYPHATDWPYFQAFGGTPNSLIDVPTISASAPAVPVPQKPTNAVGRFADAATLAGEMIKNDPYGERPTPSGSWSPGENLNPSALDGRFYAQETQATANRATTRSASGSATTGGTTSGPRTTASSGVPETAPVEEAGITVSEKPGTESTTARNTQASEFDPQRIPVARVQKMVRDGMAWFYQDDRFWLWREAKDKYAFVTGVIGDKIVSMILEKYQPTKTTYVNTPDGTLEFQEPDGPTYYRIANPSSWLIPTSGTSAGDLSKSFNKWNTQDKAQKVIGQFPSNRWYAAADTGYAAIEFTFRMLPLTGTALEILDADEGGGAGYGNINWKKVNYGSVAISFVSDVATVASLGAWQAAKAGNVARVKTLTQVGAGLNAAASVGQAIQSGHELLTDKEQTKSGAALKIGVTILALWGAKMEVSDLNKAVREAQQLKLNKAANQTVDGLTGAAGDVKKAADEFVDRADNVVTRSAAPTLDLLNKSCFAAGTPLLTPLGHKPIESIVVGDLLLTRNEHDADSPVESRTVEAVFERVGEVVELCIGGRKIASTAEHPFFVDGKGWVQTQHLEPGDRIVSHDGQRIELIGAQRTDHWTTVYNVRVTECHTYFVGASDWGFSLWAHNLYYPRSRDGAKTWEVVDDVTGAVVQQNVTASDAARLANDFNAAAARGMLVPRTQFPTNDAQLQHIFRNAPGHLADTPANRALLQGLADDAGALLGADRFGNQWFAKMNVDGTQTWVQVRNGIIINGGINLTPRTFNPVTGLSGGGP